MKKLLIIVLMVLMTLSLSSCDAIKLDKAFTKLATTNYTMEGTMTIVVVVSENGKPQRETATGKLYMESSPEEVYTIVTADGKEEYSYAKINFNSVETYIYDKGIWKREGVQSITDYTSNSDFYFLDITTMFAFQLKDGVYVGDTYLITNMLSDYADGLAASIFGSDINNYEFNVKKYNIIMTDENISKINVEMEFSITQDSVKATVKIEMPMEIRNVGTTVVTNPLEQ